MPARLLTRTQRPEKALCTARRCMHLRNKRDGSAVTAAEASLINLFGLDSSPPLAHHCRGPGGGCRMGNLGVLTLEAARQHPFHPQHADGPGVEPPPFPPCCRGRFVGYSAAHLITSDKARCNPVRRTPDFVTAQMPA